MKSTLIAPVRFLPAVLILLFATCNNDSSLNGPVTIVTKCLLNTVVNPTLNYAITRDPDGLPVELDYFPSTGGSETICVIEYDVLHRVLKMTENGLNYFSYTYDGGGNITVASRYSRSSTSAAWQKADEITYHYNNSGYIDSTHYLSGVIDYERFEYDQTGNLIKTFRKEPNKAEVLQEENLTFDSQKNPFITANFLQYTVVVSPLTTLTGLRLPKVSTHNVTSKNVTQSDGSVVKVTYTFEYNGQGYPTRCKELNEYYYYDCI